MVAVDLGVLAAAINRFSPQHARASAAVELLAGGERPWALPWSVVHRLLDLVTHPHAVARPVRPAEAWEFVAPLLASPSVSLLRPGERHAAVTLEVLEGLEAGPGLPPGFETAVLLREHGVREILSSDPEMRRFPFLSVRNPFHGGPWSPEEARAGRYRRLTLPRAGR